MKYFPGYTACSDVPCRRTGQYCATVCGIYRTFSLFRLLSKVTHNFAAVNKNFANNIKSLRALLTDEAYSEVSSSTHPSYEFPYSRTHSNMNAQVYTIIYKRHGI